MKNRTLAVLSGTCLLAACGSIYYAPKGSATANLRITNQSLMGELGAGIFENPHCTDGGKAMGFNPVKMGQSSNYLIDAGQPVTFVVDGDRGSVIKMVNGTLADADIRRCPAPGRFTPNTGGSYEVVFKDDGKACSAEVFDIRSGERRPHPYQKLVWGSAPAENPKGNCAPAP